MRWRSSRPSGFGHQHVSIFASIRRRIVVANSAGDPASAITATGSGEELV
jgi:hypothetical protein